MTLMNVRKGNPLEKLSSRASVQALTDVFEDKNEVLLVVDMPGVTEDGLAVRFDKGQLTLEGRRGKLSGDALQAEFEGRDYYRAFSVPQGIQTNEISAELKNGTLRVHLPKAESARPRQIPVRAS